MLLPSPVSTAGDAMGSGVGTLMPEPPSGTWLPVWFTSPTAIDGHDGVDGRHRDVGSAGGWSVAVSRRAGRHDEHHEAQCDCRERPTDRAALHAAGAHSSLRRARRAGTGVRTVIDLRRSSGARSRSGPSATDRRDRGDGADGDGGGHRHRAWRQARTVAAVDTVPSQPPARRPARRRARRARSRCSRRRRAGTGGRPPPPPRRPSRARTRRGPSP